MIKVFNIFNNNDELFEMANINKKKSGLPINLWIDSIGKDRNVKHNIPRVKIQNNYNESISSKKELIPVSISKDPEILLKDNKFKLEIKKSDLDKVFKFISDNYDTLMSHWNKEIDDQDALNILLNKEKDI